MIGANRGWIASGLAGMRSLALSLDPHTHAILSTDRLPAQPTWIILPEMAWAREPSRSFSQSLYPDSISFNPRDIARRPVSLPLSSILADSFFNSFFLLPNPARSLSFSRMDYGSVLIRTRRGWVLDAVLPANQRAVSKRVFRHANG